MMKFRLTYTSPSGYDYAGFNTEREALTWAAQQEENDQIKALNLLKYNEDEGLYEAICSFKNAPIVAQWELDKVRDWTVSDIKNAIWSFVDGAQPIPGCVSVTALRLALLHRGEEPIGYHNT